MTKAQQKVEERAKRRLLEAYSHTGSIYKAADLVGIGMEQATRALLDPDGLSYLDEISRRDQDKHYFLSRSQRKSVLTMAFVGGILPRVKFDEDGNPTKDQITFDNISPQQRIKCLELLGKMEGDFIERQVEKEVEKKVSEQITPEVRDKLDEIYGRTTQVIDYDPLS